MIIYFYDGSYMECNEIRIVDCENAIVDGVRYIKLIEIQTIEAA